jgi:hypothetical protein
LGKRRNAAKYILKLTVANTSIFILYILDQIKLLWLKNTLWSDEIPAVKPLKSKVILAVWEFANAKNPSYAACVQNVTSLKGNN